jgi:hypothetical protein
MSWWNAPGLVNGVEGGEADLKLELKAAQARVTALPSSSHLQDPLSYSFPVLFFISL